MTTYTLSGPARFEQDIKKSTFLALAAPVEDEAAARAFLAANSDADATHNCWAYRFGQAYRFSDDGEPSGTAGKPILAAIDGQALDSVVVLVIRWFGGILLGSGGLVRAYGGTAAQCLRLAEKSERIARATLRFHLPFSDLALVKARLAARPGLALTGEVFTGNGADLEVAVPEGDTEALIEQIRNLTSARALLLDAD